MALRNEHVKFAYYQHLCVYDFRIALLCGILSVDRLLYRFARKNITLATEEEERGKELIDKLKLKVIF